MNPRLFLLSLAVLLIVSGCKKDPCEGINCLHGVCNDGVCICESGWDGEFCTIDADPCRNVNCTNGTCANGTCICDPGYEGSNCENAMNTKFAGQYLMFETCSPSGQAGPYLVPITASSASAAVISFSGLWEYPGTVTTATVGSDGKSFTIPLQSFGSGGWGIDGSGSINVSGTTVSLTYTVYDSNLLQLDQCVATMSK